MTILLFKSGQAEIQPNFQILRNSVASEQAAQILKTGVGVNQFLKIFMSLSPGVEQVQAIRNILSGDPAQAVQALKNQILEKDIIQKVQALFNSIGDVGPEFVATDYDIFLDGVSIKGQIIQCDVTFTESQIHNTFELTSIDRELFFKANPQILEGQTRIEVEIGARSIKFLLEDRQGDEVFFSLWGRSISARDDAPYTETVDYTLEDTKLASEIAAEMATANSVDWDTTDFLVPKTFEFQGEPVDGIRTLARVVGGVVRSKDDGTIHVRDRWPVRPVNMQTATPDVDYDRVSNIIAIQYENERGLGHDTVEVYGESPESVIPTLEVEESNPVIGNDVHVRVYWRGFIPATVTALVTDGLLTYLGRFIDDFSQDVVFTRKTGSVSKPIYDITSISWIGLNGGTYTFEQFDTGIEVDADWAIGTVNYRSQYDRFRCYSHNVSKLLKAIEFAGSSNVGVRVTMGLDPALRSFANPITDELITSVEAATARGTAYLDDNRYNKKTVSVRVPYYPDAIDGNTANLNDANIEVLGKYKITEVVLTFRGPQIIETVTVSQCQTF